MSIFDFIERFILFVIPGVIVYAEFGYLTGRYPQAEILTISNIFINSILSYMGGNLFLMLMNQFPKSNLALVDIVQMLSGDKQSITAEGLFFAIVAACLIGMIAVAISEHRVLFRLANKLSISQKTDNDEVWDYLFDQQPWIIFRDYVTGNTYYGRVERCSDKRGLRELLLEEVSVWSVKDGDYKMEKVYLSRQPSEFSIEIDNYTEEREKDDAANTETAASTV